MYEAWKEEAKFKRWSEVGEMAKKYRNYYLSAKILAIISISLTVLNIILTS